METQRARRFAEFMLEHNLHALNTLWSNDRGRYTTRAKSLDDLHEGTQIDFCLASGAIRSNTENCELILDCGYTRTDHVIKKLR